MAAVCWYDRAADEKIGIWYCPWFKAMALSSGTRIGPYEVSAPIGAGGMGEVYRARDSRLNRDVAIKTLPASVADDANRLARFQREAQLLASLSHPNIAAVYGLEDSSGVRALVMELVEGPTLAERIAAGPIPLEEAMGIARQIGEALEAAHDKGVIHRDLKPANIKLTPEGKVKVLDFGLAKAFDAEVASGNPVNSPTLTMDATRAGVILGTAGYMAPEQARGKAVDKRADIWAFGVVLFEMLTGKTTFDGETVSDTLAAVLRADIEWRQLPADTPPKVRRLLQRCLERDPKKRLRDIGDAWFELDAPEETVQPARPAPARRSGLWWVPWAAAAVIGGAGVVWGLLHRPPGEPRTTVRWTYAQKDYFGLPALSRDGTKMVYNEVKSGALDLALRMMDQIDGKPIPGSDGMFFPQFSPDGQWILAFVGTTDIKIRKIPVSGGTPITLADAPAPFGATWGDDDTVIFSGGKGLMRLSGAGGTPQTLTTPDEKKGEVMHRAPHFLPGSRSVAFTIATGSSNQIAVLDLKKPPYRVVVNNGSDGRYVPSGHLVYLRGGTLFAAPFDPGSLTVTGAEAPVVEGVASNGPGGSFAEFAFSDPGLMVYMQGSGQGGKTTMGWVDRQGQIQTLSDADLWGTGRLSPDARRVANQIHTANGKANAGDIWTWEVERRTRTRLTFEGDNADPIWTPDGKRITFGARVGDKVGLYWVPADGSARPELLGATEAFPAPSSWSPDGKSLLFSQASGGKTDRIWVLPVAAGVAGKPTLLHNAAAYEKDGELSPDGRWVAYVSSETGQSEIYVHPFPGPGGKIRVSTQGGLSVRWSRNGKELFYMGSGTEGNLYAVDVQPGPELHLGLPRVLVKATFGTTWDPAPDGKKFLIEQSVALEQAGRRLVGVSDWFAELTRRVPGKR